MYVVTSCWFSGFTSLPRTWFCTHCWGKQSCELQDLNMSCCSLLYWTYHVSWEKNWREDDPTLCIFARGTLHIFARGSKFANISASAAHTPRRGHLLLFECSLLPLEGSLSCCMKCRLQIFTTVFATVVDYAFIVQGPSPTSQGLSLMLPEFLPLFVCFVASVACCQVAKLPSCQVVSFFCFHPHTE